MNKRMVTIPLDEYLKMSEDLKEYKERDKEHIDNSKIIITTQLSNGESRVSYIDKDLNEGIKELLKKELKLEYKISSNDKKTKEELMLTYSLKIEQIRSRFLQLYNEATQMYEASRRSRNMSSYNDKEEVFTEYIYRKLTELYYETGGL